MALSEIEKNIAKQIYDQGGDDNDVKEIIEKYRAGKLEGAPKETATTLPETKPLPKREEPPKEESLMNKAGKAAGYIFSPENIGQVTAPARGALTETIKIVGGLGEAGLKLNPVVQVSNLIMKKATGNDQLKKDVEQISALSEQLKAEAQKVLGVDPDSLGTKAGEVTANVAIALLPWMPKTGAIGSAVPLLSKLAKVIEKNKMTKGIGDIVKAAGVGAKEGAIQTSKLSLQQGEIPTTEQIGAGASMGAAIGGAAGMLEKAGGKIIQSALSQTPKSVQTEAIKKTGKTIGELYEETPIKGLKIDTQLESVKSNLQNTYSTILKSTEGKTFVSPTKLKEDLKTDILKKLDVDKLGDTPQVASIKANVDDALDYYVGKGDITPENAVRLVKEINAELPAGALKESTKALSIEQQSTISKALKQGLQTKLEEAIPGIKTLYSKYGKNKILESALDDIEVKKMLGRQLLGTAIGSGPGISEISQGKYLEGSKDVILGGLIGGFLTKYGTSPATLLTLGKSLGLPAKNLAGITGTKEEISRLILDQYTKGQE